MEDPRDAADSVKGVTGMKLDGREIRVEVSHGIKGIHITHILSTFEC